MTPAELRQILLDQGVHTRSDFELVLNTLIENMLMQKDPSLEHFSEEEQAFGLGFTTGSVAAFHVFEESWRKVVN